MSEDEKYTVEYTVDPETTARSIKKVQQHLLDLVDDIGKMDPDALTWDDAALLLLVSTFFRALD